MPYVKLPKNIKFSEPRKTGAQKDEFDIFVDSKKVHTFSFDTSQIKGNSSEAFIIAQAHIDAKDWLRSHHMLPKGE